MLSRNIGIFVRVYEIQYVECIIYWERFGIIEIFYVLVKLLLIVLMGEVS